MLSILRSNNRYFLFSFLLAFCLLTTTPGWATGARACKDSAPYETRSMQAHFVGEDTKGNGLGNPQGRTVYLDAGQRSQLAIQVKGGLLYLASDSTTPLTIQEGLYVMDSGGNIYVGDRNLMQKVGITLGKEPGVPRKTARFYFLHHSSFLAGGAVAAAGHITVRAGVVTEINNESGHYRPADCNTRQAVAQLTSLGANTGATSVKDSSAPAR